MCENPYDVYTFLVLLLTLIVLFWYACETFKLRKISLNQLEIDTHPWLSGPEIVTEEETLNRVSYYLIITNFVL